MQTEREIYDIVIKYENIIKFYFSNKVNNHDDIDDLVQETLYQIVKSLPKFRQKSQLSTWIYSICRNTLHTYYYQKKKQNNIKGKLNTRESDHLIDYIEIKLIIDNFEKPLNIIYDLYYRKNYKITEIAELLDKPVGTIKYWLFRLRIRLKDSVNPF